MSLTRRKRIAALVLAGAAVSGLAFAGSTAANAEPLPAAATATSVNVTLAPPHGENLVVMTLDGLGQAVSANQIVPTVTCDAVPYLNTGFYRSLDRYGQPQVEYWFVLPESLAGKSCVVAATSVSSSQRVFFEQPHGTEVKGHIVTFSRTGGL